MQGFLTDYTQRLEAFQSGQLVDVNLVAARYFEQPVALTLGLMQTLSPNTTKLTHEQVLNVSKIVQQAYHELVQASGSRTSRDTVIVDFDMTLPDGSELPSLRVIFSFTEVDAQDMTIPAVTVGRGLDFEPS